MRLKQNKNLLHNFKEAIGGYSAIAKLENDMLDNCSAFYLNIVSKMIENKIFVKT